MKGGLEDFREGLRRADLWRRLAWYDVRRNNVMTSAGVFWHSIAFFIVGAGLGFLFSSIMGRPYEVYVPYIAGGFAAWACISAPLSEGTGVIMQSRGFLTQMASPISLYVLRFVCKQAYLLGLSLVGYFAVLLVYGLVPKPNLLLLAPGFALLSVTAVAVTTIVAGLNVLHRWIQSFLPSVMRLMFFVTPIIWLPGMLVGLTDGVGDEVGAIDNPRVAFVMFNPFYHYLEIFRGPLVGYEVNPVSWVVTSVLTVFLSVAAVYMVDRFKLKVLVRL